MGRQRAAFFGVAIAASLLLANPVQALTESLPELSSTKIHGAHENERLGESVADAGDFNGDGFGDLAVGGRARAYIVFGGPEEDVQVGSSARDIEIGFATADRANDFVVAGARDVNADGYGDLLVGVQQTDPLGRRNAGSAFLVFGRPDPDPILLDPVPAPGVVRIDGAERGDRAGTAVAPAGDVDGDDIPDVIIGAPRADDGSGERRGAAYVLFGRALTKHIDLALPSSEGYRIAGPDFGRDVGKSVSTAGDMNGDDLDDVIVGAPSSFVIARPAAYVVFGQTTTAPVSLASLDDRGWLIRAGDRENEEGAGEAVSGGHDVNADGIPDVVVGAPNAGAPYARNGVVFVIFGKADPTTIALDALGADGFRIEAGDEAQQVGSAVALIPDQDGNGSADILVGSPEERRGWRSATYPGAVYHLVGQTSTDRISLWRLGGDGVRYTGQEWEEAGYAVASVTDFHGDEETELVSGAPRAEIDRREYTGRVYIFNPVEAPLRDNPPRVEVRSYDAFQKAERGSYCWDGVCVDRRPTFPKVEVAGTRNRAHYRVMLRERPDSFSLSGYRQLDEFGNPTGAPIQLDSTLEPVRLYRGAPISSFEAVFRLPRQPGDLYLVGTASWEGDERGDASWFSHLQLTKAAAHTFLPSPPGSTLKTDDLSVPGAPFSNCWSQAYSDGTGSTLCSDYYRLGPLKARPARAGERAFIRIHSRYRPDRIRLRFFREVDSSGLPIGRKPAVRIRLRPHLREGLPREWDAHFRLPARPGHVYPLINLTYDGHGTAPYDWHLRLR